MDDFAVQVLAGVATAAIIGLFGAAWKKVADPNFWPRVTSRQIRNLIIFASLLAGVLVSFILALGPVGSFLMGIGTASVGLFLADVVLKTKRRSPAGRSAAPPPIAPEPPATRPIDAPAQPAHRPSGLSASEHEILRELARRASHYPDVFRPSILSWRAGDDKQGYQSDHIRGAAVPDDAKAMLEHDRDFTPLLLRQGFLHQESRDKFTIDDSLFHAYGFEPPA